MATRSSRPAGPRPFSSEWLESGDTAPAPEPRLVVPFALPDGATLSAVLVVIVSLAVMMATLIGNRSTPSALQAAIVAPTAVTVPTVAVAVAQPTSAAAGISAAPTQAPIAVAQAVPTEAAPPAITAAPEFAQVAAVASTSDGVATAPAEGLLLPKYRIITYYGHPHDPNMGIVGEYEMDELAGKLRAEAANFAAADPSRPVIPAFELIATVAQGVPGADGTFILDTDHETLQSYIDYAAQHGMLVVLDIQIGRGTVAAEIEKIRDLLELPNVHLAIDPEFAIAEGETPGIHIGSVTSDDILYAQQTLADISASNGLPPKMLIVHQFREDMIGGKENLAPYPGVQLVIDADGYGVPELKTAVYNFLVRDEPIEFGAIKIFYRQDVPVMTAEEILALVPPPDVIIYQ